jgi:transposase-like protein
MSKLRGMKELFAGRHFDRDVIILCVRWYLCYKPSFRDLVEMMAERGLHLSYTTIMRWVQRYAPEFEKRWTRYARKVGRSWRVDETYLKVRGRWTYLYRAADQDGNTVDFRLSPTRDVVAAKVFFGETLRTQRRAPVSITLDGCAASHRAVGEMPKEGEAWKHTQLRSSKYLNNLIEHDHRNIKIPNRADARLQELRLCSHDHRRHRTAPSHSQRTIRAWTSPSQGETCTSNLECGTRRIVFAPPSDVAPALAHICTRTGFSGFW